MERRGERRVRPRRCVCMDSVGCRPDLDPCFSTASNPGRISTGASCWRVCAWYENQGWPVSSVHLFSPVVSCCHLQTFGRTSSVCCRPPQVRRWFHATLAALVRARTETSPRKAEGAPLFRDETNLPEPPRVRRGLLCKHYQGFSCVLSFPRTLVWLPSRDSNPDRIAYEATALTNYTTGP